MKILSLAFFLSFITNTIFAIDQIQYFNINKSLTLNHILPRYKIFLDQTRFLDKETTKFCKNPSKSSLSNIRKAFHSSADAWASVQHIKFGPIEDKMRLNRIFYWPDKHGVGSRHFRRLIKSKDESKLNPNIFPSISVALQGFPTLERLFFSQEEKLLKKNVNSQFRCKLARAISKNLLQISESVLNEWKDQIKKSKKNTSLSSTNIFNEDRELFKQKFDSLYEILRLIHEFKLRKILGDTPNESRPKRAEAWRSGRSLRNIILNLEALQKLFNGEGGIGIDKLIENNNPKSNTAYDFKNFLEKTLSTAKNISLPLYKAVSDPKQFKQVNLLKTQVLKLTGFVSTRISSELGLAGPGFNSLDGD